MDKNRAIFHLIYGILLSLMGLMLFVQAPQVMERIVRIEYYAPIKWFIRIIIYLIAVMLVVGGGRKIFDNYKKLTTRHSN